MYIKEKYKMMEDKAMNLNRETIKGIVKQGMDTYKNSSCREIENQLPDCLDGIDKDNLIAGLIYLNEINARYIKLIRDSSSERDTQIKQLQEKLSKANSCNEKLVARVQELEKSNKTSVAKEAYRNDVDSLTITSLLLKGYSKSEVAKKLGVSRQTIYRRLEEKSK